MFNINIITLSYSDATRYIEPILEQLSNRSNKETTQRDITHIWKPRKFVPKDSKLWQDNFGNVALETELRHRYLLTQN